MSQAISLIYSIVSIDLLIVCLKSYKKKHHCRLIANPHLSSEIHPECAAVVVAASCLLSLPDGSSSLSCQLICLKLVKALIIAKRDPKTISSMDSSGFLLEVCLQNWWICSENEILSGTLKQI